MEKPAKKDLSPKKFRKSPEVVSFYRFIHSYDLRREALDIINKIIKKK